MVFKAYPKDFKILCFITSLVSALSCSKDCLQVCPKLSENTVPTNHKACDPWDICIRSMDWRPFKHWQTIFICCLLRWLVWSHPSLLRQKLKRKSSTRISWSFAFDIGEIFCAKRCCGDDQSARKVDWRREEASTLLFAARHEKVELVVILALSRFWK